MIIVQFYEIYLRVVCFPSSRLVNVSRLKGRISRIHQCHFKDSLISICSPEESLRLNWAMRRPTASASKTIHLRGGLLRFSPAFSTFPPPLYTGTSPIPSRMLGNGMHLHIRVRPREPNFHRVWTLSCELPLLFPDFRGLSHIFILSGWSAGLVRS